MFLVAHPLSYLIQQTFIKFLLMLGTIPGSRFYSLFRQTAKSFKKNAIKHVTGGTIEVFLW